MSAKSTPARSSDRPALYHSDLDSPRIIISMVMIIGSRGGERNDDDHRHERATRLPQIG
jgi:hypothetical protein